MCARRQKKQSKDGDDNRSGKEKVWKNVTPLTDRQRGKEHSVITPWRFKHLAGVLVAWRAIHLPITANNSNNNSNNSDHENKTPFSCSVAGFRFWSVRFEFGNLITFTFFGLRPFSWSFGSSQLVCLFYRVLPRFCLQGTLQLVALGFHSSLVANIFVLFIQISVFHKVLKSHITGNSVKPTKYRHKWWMFKLRSTKNLYWFLNHKGLQLLSVF